MPALTVPILTRISLEVKASLKWNTSLSSTRRVGGSFRSTLRPFTSDSDCRDRCRSSRGIRVASAISANVNASASLNSRSTHIWCVLTIKSRRVPPAKTPRNSAVPMDVSHESLRPLLCAR